MLNVQPPSCIVIGCKNGEGKNSTSVKYYQVPSINSSSIARQWYINTLREDLLDLVTKSSSSLAAASSSYMPPPHHVCIEHFDEESFVPVDTNQDEPHIALKEDAVPSLFEIEVFQKMIAHQEQIAINQERQQQQQQKQILETSPSHLNPAGQKRSRIDPDFRAALIQRMPKALKRTMPPIQPQMAGQTQRFAQKAVKHTMPMSSQRNLSTNTRMQDSTANSTSSSILSEIIKSAGEDLVHQSTNATVKPAAATGKSMKYMSSLATATTANNAINLDLKNLLPPPIMQSTKRPLTNLGAVINSSNNSNIKQPSAQKAVKRTGGGPYYHQQQQTLTQLSLNNLNNSSNSAISPIVSATPSLIGSREAASNRVTITTTYVYKRVTQPLEINLIMECEDEEVIEVKVPASERLSTPVQTAQVIELSEEANKKKESMVDMATQADIDADGEKEPTTEAVANKTTQLALESRHRSKSSGKVVIQHASKVKWDAVQSGVASTSSKRNFSSSSSSYDLLNRYYSRRRGAPVGGKGSVPTDLRIGNYPAKVKFIEY